MRYIWCLCVSPDYIGIDSGNESLKAFSGKELSVKVQSYIYAPKAETENNILDKEGCLV